VIVDVHYHYLKRPADETRSRILIDSLIEQATRLNIKRPYDEVFGLYYDYLQDDDGNKLVKRMDASGIDVSVICVVDNYSDGLPDERVLRVNEKCAQAAARHPGRLISLAGIDPRRSNAPSLFRKCLTDFKMNGLKWHPDQGYYPNSQEAYAVLSIANEFGVPLLTHCGPFSNTRAKFAHPVYLDDIALDFPNVNIIAAHMGSLWWHDWAALAQYKKNIYGDLAMWQLTVLTRMGIFRNHLREILDNLGPEKVLWSSDGPLFEPFLSNKQWIDVIKGLTTKGEDGIVFSQEEVDAILGGNAANIFKINNK
jgi:predicted TIM-barrel fold metal-dependent hydrolase